MTDVGCLLLACPNVSRVFFSFSLWTNLNETSDTNEVNSYEHRAVWVSLERHRIASSMPRRPQQMHLRIRRRKRERRQRLLELRNEFETDEKSRGCFRCVFKSRNLILLRQDHSNQRHLNINSHFVSDVRWVKRCGGICSAVLTCSQPKVFNLYIFKSSSDTWHFCPIHLFLPFVHAAVPECASRE